MVTLPHRSTHSSRQYSGGGSGRATPSVASCLEGVLQRELQEAGIGGVVLEELCSRDLAALWADALVGRIAPRGLVQQVEGIRAELQILFTEGDEVFEQRHVNCGISGPVDLIGPATREGYRGAFIGYNVGSRDPVSGQRILERTGVVPVVPRLDPGRVRAGTLVFENGRLSARKPTADWRHSQ